MKTIREQIEAAAHVIRSSGEMIGSTERWMISRAEMSIFDITQAEWPLLAATYDAYLAFLDIVDPAAVGLDDDVIEAQRNRWPMLLNPTYTVSEKDFALLAAAWAGIDARQAGKAYAKIRFWNERTSA